MVNFDYKAPETISDAIAYMKSDGEVRALAGGTDLIDQLKSDRRNADLVVDLKKIPELQGIRMQIDGLHIGAVCSCSDVRDNTIVKDVYRGLGDASGLIGSIQIQNRAAIGGNVCNAAPSADSTPTLMVHDAKALIVGQSGTRIVELSDFFVGPGQTILKKGELLQELILPKPAPKSASAYLRFIPRNEMDIAVAGVACFIEMDESKRTISNVRISLASVAPTPIRARVAEEILMGQLISNDLIMEAGDAAVESATPITDVRGSAEYRKELIKVLTRRTISMCMERINH